MKSYPARIGGRQLGASGLFGFLAKGALCLWLMGLACGPVQAQVTATLQQGSNGTAEAPINAVDWVTTSITAQRGHFVEGASMPYRLALNALLPGAHRAVIAWDTKNGGRHATDYLTHYNRMQPHNQFGQHTVPETIQPLRDTSGGFDGPFTFAIPAPPSLPTSSFHALPANERLFHIYNGTITGAAYVSEGDLGGASAESRVAIDFVADATTVLILFGGHLATKDEWGPGQTAGGMPGQAYRMRLVELDGIPTLATVTMQGQAVVSPPTCGISGFGAVCPFTTNSYTAGTDVANATFAWSLTQNSSGAAIIGLNSGPTVEVRSGTAGGSYVLQVAITAGALHSTCARNVTVLTNVSLPPLANRSVCPGGTTTFGVEPSGTGPFTFVWRKGAQILPGATNKNLVLSNATETDGGAYCVEVSGPCNTATACANLTVLANTTATPLANLSRCVGESATFSTTASGAGPFTYRWRKNGVEIPGQTNRSYSIPVLALGDAGTYTVEVTGLCNSVTNSGTLVVHALPPCGIQGPGTVCPQSSGGIFVAPDGMAAYRWRVTGNGTIVGATNQQVVSVAASGAGFLTLNLTVVNSNGCSRSCSRTINIGDLQTPVIVCPEDIQTNTAPALCSRAVEFTVAATDNCAGTTVTCNPPSGTHFPKGATTVTCTATDGTGNQAGCSFNVTVVDLEKPVLTCPTNLTVNTQPGLCEASVTYAVGVSDNCPGASLICSPPSGTIFPLGASSVTCRGSDAAGNIEFCAFDVTVADNEAPQITCPADFILFTDPDQCDLLVDYDVQATDNCAMAAVVCLPPSGSLFSQGITPVLCVATDVNQNQSFCSFRVQVDDGQNPRIACPGDISVTAEPDRCDAVLNFALKDSDNCPDVSVTCVPPSGARFPVGQTNVVCTATDGSGNSASCTFRVTVSDQQRPVLTCPQDLTVNTPTGRCDALVQYTATVTDNCPGAREECIPPAGSVFALGATIVNCLAVDASSNAVSCAFNVVVQDTESPALRCPENVTTTAGPGTCAAVVEYDVSATDNCGEVEVFCAPESGSAFALGETSVYCVAVDTSGNARECGFSVIVNDAERPVITCPADIITQTETGRCDAVRTFLATATDNCAVLPVTCVPASGSTFPKGTNIVNCTARDPSGNSSGCAFRVIVQDREAPAIVCPSDIFAQCAPGTCDAAVLFAPVVSDNCGPASVVCSPPSGSRFAVGVTNVTCVATDASGNTNRCSFTVNVRDDQPPAITCPADIVTVTEPGACDARVTFSANASDNCAVASVTCVPPSGTRFAKGTTTVECTATDTSGNQQGCAFTVTVDDNQAPAITCSTNRIVATEPGRCDALVTFSVNASDNCAVASLTCTPPSGSRFAKGATPVVCIAIDSSGNQQGCAFSVTVNDNEPPAITCPTTRVVPAEADRCDAAVSFAPVVSDNCPGATLVCSPPSGARFVVGQTAVTCVATDASGNTNRCTFLVIVNDLQQPAVTCPNDIVTVAASGTCDAEVVFSATATDNCPAVSFLCVPPSGSRFARGATTVGCTARDASGNAAACAFTVTVNDTQPPAVTCPANIVTNTSSGRCDAVVSYAASVSDNCAGANVICTPASGATFPRGLTPVNCVATDASGNTNVCGFTVTVEDRENPVITCPPPQDLVTAPGRCDAVATFEAAATDNCGGVGVTCAPPSGSRFAKGVNSVICTARDSSGNTAICSFAVAVRDIEPPVLTCPTNIVTATDAGRCDALVAFTPTAADNCPGLTVVCMPPTGTRFTLGTSTVNCTATDASSNSVTCGFTVQVEDRENPQLICPASVITNTAPGRCDRVVEFAPVAADNCAGTEVACHPPSGSTFPLGTNEVFCVAADAAGNQDSCGFAVVVRDDERPAIVCPSDISASTEPARCDALVTFAASATDNCGPPLVVCDPPSASRFSKGATPVVCTALDASGSLAACSFTVTVSDNEPPVVSCPQDLVLDTDAGKCSARATFSAQVSDNCPGATVVCVPPSNSDFPIGATTVVCQGTDAAGNARLCAFDVRVIDAEPPTLLCPGDLTIDTEPTQCTATVSYLVTGNDSCSLTNLVCTPPSGSIFAKGTLRVQCAARDASGNEATCAFNVTVRDTEPPTLLCATNLAVPADLGRCNAVVQFAPSASDNCPGVELVCVPPAGSTFALGNTPVSCTATDAAGNTNRCAFTVRVIDTQRPVLTCSSNLLVNAESNRCDAVVIFPTSFTDNCAVMSMSCTPFSGSRFPRGSTPVLCSATDAAGNVGTCSFTVTVRDTQSPVLQCPSNIIALAETDRCDATVTFNVAAGDNCGAVIASCFPPSGSVFPVGTTPVGCSAFDGSSNLGSCQFTVTVQDLEAPALQCPADVFVNTASGQCETAVSFNPQAADNCPGVSVTCAPPSGSSFPKGTNIVSCTARDTSSNSVNCAFRVVVRDLEKPEITCPSDIVTNTVDGQCRAQVTYSAAVVDNCPGVTVSCTPPSNAFFNKGVTTVLCVATDASGNTNRCSFSVTVNDNRPPIITCPANISTNAAPGQLSTVVQFAPVVADNCPGVTFTCAPQSGSIFFQGVTPVTCTALDASGNTQICSFSVTVLDVEPPVINCPTNLIVATTPGRCDAVAGYVVTATDNSPSATVLCAPPSGSLLPKGLTEIRCTATDSASNSVSCAFTITVADFEKPLIACPTNMTVNTEPGRCDARVTYAADVTDNCGGASLTCTPPSGSFFAKGTNSVSCTATDASGNRETCAFTVRVIDNERPVIACPTNMVLGTPPGQCQLTVNYNATVQDNCPGATVSCVPPPGSTFTTGTTTVNCTARDAGANTALCSFAVEVRDEEDPVITCPTQIETSTLPGTCGAPIAYSSTVSDNCPGAEIFCFPSSGATLPIGTNWVICAATDATGNFAECSFPVIVRDLERPTLTCPADIIIDGSSGNCAPVASYAPTAQDNCPGATVSCVPPSGSTFPQGATPVQCTVVDRGGSPVTCAFSVIVRLEPLTATPLTPQVRCPGETALFATTADGAGPIAFTWLKNGVVLPGQTNTSLLLSNLTAANSGTYAVAVRGPCGGLTNSAALIVNAPVVVNGLTNVTRCDCDPLVLSPTVSGTGPFSYLWRKNGSVLATTPTLEFSKLSTNDAGVYTVEVSGACNTAAASASVTVIKVPNPAVYTNSVAITINDLAPAFPYPSSVRVACVLEPVKRATVTLRGFSHAYPDDVDILLAAPDGQSVILMSDAGDGSFANNVNITLDDAAAIALPDASQLFTGTFRPANYEPGADPFPPPAPKLAPANALSALAGTGANGFWSLFVVDDFQVDSGVINNGWVLRLYWESEPVRLTAPRMLPNGAFQMTVIGDPQTTCVIEASTDLRTWTPIGNVTLSGPQTDFTDPDPAPARFYRATQP